MSRPGVVDLPHRLSPQVLSVRLAGVAGDTAATNPFFSFYFFITFVHFLHVLAGTLFLNSYRRRSAACVDSRAYLTGLENSGLFWHYVDMLWIFIFPLLYLI